MISNIINNGSVVKLNTSHPLHFDGMPKRMEDKEDMSASFAQMLNKVLDGANDSQVESENLMQKMVSQPESVDIHNVMIAAQKAELSLTLVRSVRDEAMRGYRELMNLR